ncbi:MAG: serine/threonine-protein phosphatase [Proteobacteria bacterium]|nr:serine/threonine-protein phosphatase [Pseudomonadota bacterium]MCP4917758.1 serine/threonine-protein phosphatase [Pseudomonadota bacterium]
MSQAAFKAAALSEIGPRETQQDAFVLTETPAGILLAVCDGVGGLEGGALASQACAKALEKHIRTARSPAGSLLTEAVAAGHAYVLAKAAHADKPGMSTTCVVGLLSGNTLRGAWVGNSRLAVLDESGFHWLTEDHVDKPGSNLLVRAIGMGGELRVANTLPRPLSPGDVLLVCSDGVHGVLDDNELFDILSLHEPKEACRRIQLVLERRAGDDNATAVVLRLNDDISEDPTRELTFDEVREHLDPPAVDQNRKTTWLVIALAVVAALAAAFLLLPHLGAP